MKGLKLLAVTLLGVAVLASAAPASAKAAAFKHYVACGLSAKSKPSHVCPRGGSKGAFFRSNNADVTYKVCVKFPTGRRICEGGQQAAQGTLFVNKITTNIPGRHKVTWFVKGKRVGTWIFRVAK
jgi:hypothetical protein